jgi:hypothetical protein
VARAEAACRAIRRASSSAAALTIFRHHGEHLEHLAIFLSGIYSPGSEAPSNRCHALSCGVTATPTACRAPSWWRRTAPIDSRRPRGVSRSGWRAWHAQCLKSPTRRGGSEGAWRRGEVCSHGHGLGPATPGMSPPVRGATACTWAAAPPHHSDSQWVRVTTSTCPLLEACLVHRPCRVYRVC